MKCIFYTESLSKIIHARGELGGGGRTPPPQEFDRNNYQRVPPLNNLLKFFQRAPLAPVSLAFISKKNLRCENSRCESASFLRPQIGIIF